MRLNPAERTHKTAPHYYLEFIYQRKSKILDFDANYAGNEKLKDAAKILLETVSTTINDAEDKQRKR
jgi:hypothetical protein